MEMVSAGCSSIRLASHNKWQKSLSGFGYRAVLAAKTIQHRKRSCLREFRDVDSDNFPFCRVTCVGSASAD